MDPDYRAVETFETAADLFTLLSFALIFATVIFGIAQVRDVGKSDLAETTFRNVKSGSAPFTDIPQKTLILVIGIDRSPDNVGLVRSGELMEVIYKNGASSIVGALDKKIDSFMDADDIHLVLFEGNEVVNYGLFVNIQEWLANHELKATVNFYRP